MREDGYDFEAHRLAIISASTPILNMNAEADSVEIDKALGELEYVIHCARKDIDSVWREAREARLPAVQVAGSSPEELAATLADLGLD